MSTHTKAEPEQQHGQYGEVLRFDAETTSTATPQDLYDVLADLGTHAQWGGRESANKNQALLTVDAPAGLAVTGTAFTSEGKAGKDRFHDRSNVTAATPGEHFAFTTQSRLERAHGPEWHVVFRHDYQLLATATRSTVQYFCSVNPVNYKPYWLKPGIKLLTHTVVNRLMRENLNNLARLAESRVER